MKPTGFCILVCCTALVGVGLQHRAGQAQTAELTRSDAAINISAVLRHRDALNEAHDVDLQGDLAYVAGKGGSIAIIDVADPSQPELVWFRRDSEELSDSETVLLAPGRLFLGTKDFFSIDVSNPRKPVFDAIVSARTKIHTINGMVRRGHYIFAANKRGIINVFDVSQPASPRLAGMLNVSQRHRISSPHDVDLFGPHLVVADPSGFGRQPGNLALFRVFDEEEQLLPDSKWKLSGKASSDALRGANRVQIRGQHAYVAGSLSPRFSDGKAMAKGIVVDLTDPSAPRAVATVDFPDLRGPNGLTVVGSIWFLAGGQTVQAYDIRETSRPSLVASLTSAEAFPTPDDNAHDLVYRDGHLYVSSQGDHGLVILRVDDERIRRLAAGR